MITYICYINNNTELLCKKYDVFVTSNAKSYIIYLYDGVYIGKYIYIYIYMYLNK